MYITTPIPRVSAYRKSLIKSLKFLYSLKAKLSLIFHATLFMPRRRMCLSLGVIKLLCLLLKAYISYVQS